MSDEEAEYVVESITAARVKKQGRGKGWEYRVRWQGYTEKDDTWEPVSSFGGSEHFVETFWARASKMLDGRDIKDLNSFKVGDEFFPVGPPMKKKKSQSAIAVSSPAASGSNTAQTPKQTKRPRSPTPTTEEPSPKRSRPSANFRSTGIPRRKSTRTLTTAEPSPRRSARKPKKEPSVVPPSEDENDDIDLIDAPAASDDPSCLTRSAEHVVHNSSPQPAEASTSAHRSRGANSLAKRQDDSEDVIGTKGQGNSTNGPSGSSLPATQKRKPGPGRSSEGLAKKSTSSLLTFEKGQLKTVKGKYVSSKTVAQEEVSVLKSDGEDIPIIVDNPPSPKPPPTGKELLQIAAQGEGDTEELPNFEESEDGPEPSASKEPSSILQRSLSLAKESLFPSTWAPTALTNVWNKRPTIFGPLGLGSDKPSTPDATINTVVASEGIIQTPPFSLVLDVTSKLPVVLTALSSTDSTVLDKIVRNASQGPPGKFYSKEAALSILDTFRTGGASAKVIPAPNATESDTRNFEKLSQRLATDELFVFMVGFDLLVFCSSNASLITQRLNLPALLLEEPGNVLVERVSISNYSAYANAAIRVDTVAW